jgi:hypothetical protein
MQFVGQIDHLGGREFAAVAARPLVVQRRDTVLRVRGTALQQPTAAVHLATRKWTYWGSYTSEMGDG